jgi:hypothetical protein
MNDLLAVIALLVSIMFLSYTVGEFLDDDD